MKVTEKPSSSYSGAMTPASMELKNERVAETKAKTDVVSALVLSVMAGAFISMGATFMLVVKSDAALPFAATQLLGGFAFTLGLFLILAAGVASANGGAVGEAAITVAEGKAALDWGVAFARAVLCNMLVCLAVWVGHAATSVTDKFFSALLPVMAFMAAGFEHCVANMFFLPYALMLQATGTCAGSVDIAGVVSNLTAATLGNLVGGVVLVGVSYWFVYGRGRGRA